MHRQSDKKAAIDAWQVEHIQEGIRQADAGEFASEVEVASAFARWRKKTPQSTK